MTRLALLLSMTLFASACMNNGGMSSPESQENMQAPLGEAIEDPTDGLENENSTDG